MNRTHKPRRNISFLCHNPLQKLTGYDKGKKYGIAEQSYAAIQTGKVLTICLMVAVFLFSNLPFC